MAAYAFFLKKRLNVAPKVDFAWRLRCQQSGERGRRGEGGNCKGMPHNEPSWRRPHPACVQASIPKLSAHPFRTDRRSAGLRPGLKWARTSRPAPLPSSSKLTRKRITAGWSAIWKLGLRYATGKCEALRPAGFHSGRVTRHSYIGPAESAGPSTSRWYQPRMVSGRATQATCARALRPSRLPISASVDLSGSVRGSRLGNWARRA